MERCFGYLLSLVILEDTLLNLNLFQELIVVKDTQPVLRSMDDGLVNYEYL